MLIGKISKSYVILSNRVTNSYEKIFGLPCDIYFPIEDDTPNAFEGYDNANLFNSHGTHMYSDSPNLSTIFYIPHLLKEESMNSAEKEFDTFYLPDEQRPFIETTKAKELPISTKVVVHFEETIINFVIEKKLVVEGAGGKMILRMYLNPLEEN